MWKEDLCGKIVDEVLEKYRVENKKRLHTKDVVSRWKGGSSKEKKKYHLGQNDYSYKYEIKSKTIGLHQITDITDLY